MTQNNYPECKLKHKQCKFVFECNYFKHRFGALADPCMNEEERKNIIEERYKEELEGRQKLISRKRYS